MPLPLRIFWTAVGIMMLLVVSSCLTGWPVEEAKRRPPCASFVEKQEPWLDCEVQRR